ncbi:CotH kinase family protein [Anaerosporobacter faecicola]|uniref:CotH kinase family protein n=1 Tax=Anaerosporobacter faecicola TaxID=2718714 RepID=UPI00143922AC|nr:CotH kinase family protein [Anaerosporobacter faecicola]
MITNKHINKIIMLCIVIALVCSGVMIYLGNTDKVKESSGVSLAYESQLFDHDSIMTVDIRVDEDSWNEMIENASSEEYISCDVVINGETYSNVGIRPKGNTSLSQIVSDDTTDRFSFKVEFDHYDKNQNCYGLDKLVLNNVMSDSTYMKEYLSYDILRYAGVISPLYNYASITVNGEDWGFYLALEGMEESFAIRNYGSNYGQLYKPETMGVGGGVNDKTDQDNSKGMMPPNDQNNEQNATNTQQETRTMPDDSQMKQGMGNMGGGFGNSMSSASLQYIDDNIESYSTIFDAAVFDTDDSDYERVITAIKNLNAGTDLETYVDVDAVLRYIAANTVLVNLDSYFSSMQHNYYLYEQDGQITMLPWDYNLSFAGFQSKTATSAVNFPIDTPVSGVTLEDRPIIAKLFEKEEYLERYHQILQEIVTGYFDSGLFQSTITKINKRISSYVKTDATAFYTFDEYETGVENLIQFGLLRAKSIQGQLDGTIPSTTDGQEEDSTTLIDASNINLTAMGTQGGGDGEMKQKLDQMTMSQGQMPGDSSNNEKSQMFGDRQQMGNDPRQGMFMQEQNSQDYTNEIILLSVCGGLLAVALIVVICFKRRRFHV